MRHTLNSAVISAVISVAFIGATAACAPIEATDAGRPMDFPHRSTAFGLPSNSPQVQSLMHQDGHAPAASPKSAG